MVNLGYTRRLMHFALKFYKFGKRFVKKLGFKNYFSSYYYLSCSCHLSHGKLTNPWTKLNKITDWRMYDYYRNLLNFNFKALRILTKLVMFYLLTTLLWNGILMSIVNQLGRVSHILCPYSNSRRGKEASDDGISDWRSWRFQGWHVGAARRTRKRPCLTLFFNTHDSNDAARIGVETQLLREARLY